MEVNGIDKLYGVFLKILKTALEGRAFSAGEALLPEEWQRIFSLAEQHNVLPLVYQAVYGLKNMPIPTVAVKSRVRQLVMLQTVKTDELMQLYRRLDAEGVAPLIVKGFVCRNLYPEPDLRLSTDEDMLVAPENLKKCIEIMKEFGMYTELSDNEIDTAYEIPFYRNGGMLYIELHKSLFPPGDEICGEWNSFFKGVFDRAEKAFGVYTLSPTDHVLYLICHAFKHFVYSGFGIRQVCDLVLLLNACGASVDWQRVFEKCRSINAEIFAAALLRMGIEYLGLDAEKACVPGAFLNIDIDCTELLEDIISGGIYGSSSDSRLHSSNMTLEAVSADKRGRVGRASIKSSLFPPVDSLKGRYTYLKSRPYLLPAAWAERFWHYAKTMHRTNRTPSETIKVGAKRIELMKKYGIIGR